MGIINCYSYTPILIKKGMKFSLKIATVDYMNHSVNATINNCMTDNLDSLEEEQRIQSVACNDLIYSIVSPREGAELKICANGPCKNLGISVLRVPTKLLLPA